MKDFSRLFVIKNGECGGWTSSTRTSFVISVKNDELSVKRKSGRDMYTAEINTAFGRFLKEYEAEFGEKVALYERRNRYRFCFRQGSSGCQDTYIEIDMGDGFPVRKFMMHESCFGKSGGFGCFVYDFLDLCVAAGFFVVEDGFYAYPEDEDANSGLEMRVIKPRLIEYEEGWTSPWEKSEGVVYLRTVREKPEDPEEADDESNDDDASEDAEE